MLSGMPDYQLRHLQSVINAMARSIFNLQWSDHVKSALMEQHWLSAVDRVDFKVVTLVFRCIHDLAPPYLSSSLHRVADTDSRRRLRSSAATDILLGSRSRLAISRQLLLAIARFQLADYEHGTIHWR